MTQRLLGSWVWLALALASFAAVLFPIPCDDGWWHMHAGRHWLEHGALGVDPISFTHHGQPWVNWEWLGGVVMVLSFDAFGGAGLVALRWVAVLSTLLVLGLHLRALDRQDGREDAARRLSALVLLGLCLLVIYGRVSDRPHLYALPLLASAHLSSLSSSPRRLAPLAALMALTVVWMLVHPSWILGVALHAALVAERWREARGPDRRGLVYRISPLLIALPALALHPPAAYAAAVTRLFASQSLIEWHPLWHYLHWSNTPLLASLAVMALWLASLRGAPRPFAPSHWLLALLLLGSWRFVRFTPELAVLAVPAIHRAGARWLRARPMPARTAAMATLLAGLLLVAAVLDTKSTYGHAFSAEVDRRDNPVAAAAWLERRALSGNVLADALNAHAYLSFHCHPRLKSYIDGRVPQVFSEAFLLDYQRALAEPARFAALLAERPIDFVVLQSVLSERSAALSAVLVQRGFALVHIDDHALVWARDPSVEPTPYAMIVPPLIDDAWFAQVLAPASFARVLPELARLRREQPDSQIGATLVETLLKHPHATPEQRAALSPLAL